MRQIILDTETTGILVESGNRIIEIGCVEIIDRKFTGNEFHTFLNPGRSSEPGAFKVHQISEEFLADKPKFEEIYKKFLTFIRDAELLIHNAEFDIGFLNNEFKINSIPESIEDHVQKITDTLALARQMHPGQRNSLDVLTTRYMIQGYDRTYHGALLDSKILGEVYLAMTGGQTNLSFNDAIEEEEKILKENFINTSTSIVSIKADEEDENLHKEYLTKINN
jgi:DNA polymerase-3 subunit epsilon|tara:strand:+ start:15130 stop:15798 length:669 start_codon:yes stop_codon:yes gene_type:complete